MEPIWKLLRSTAATKTWNIDFRAALISAIVGRQWSQARCWAAGWTMLHNKCLFCVHGCPAIVPRVPPSVKGGRQKGVQAAVQGSVPGSVLVVVGATVLPPEGLVPSVPGSVPDSSLECSQCYKLPPPTEAQIAAAPVGTLRHRIYRCPHLKPLRATEAPDDMIARDLAHPVADTDLALERALFPVPFTRVPPLAKQASFHWVKRPSGDRVTGCFFTDESLLDGPSKLLG